MQIKSRSFINNNITIINISNIKIYRNKKIYNVDDEFYDEDM